MVPKGSPIESPETRPPVSTVSRRIQGPTRLSQLLIPPPCKNFNQEVGSNSKAAGLYSTLQDVVWRTIVVSHVAESCILGKSAWHETMAQASSHSLSTTGFEGASKEICAEHSEKETPLEISGNELKTLFLC